MTRDSTSHNNQPAPNKRRKITLACVQCRERKRACSGGRPRCRLCAKRVPPSDCLYVDEKAKNESYIKSLQDRIEFLERTPHPDPARSGLQSDSVFLLDSGFSAGVSLPTSGAQSKVPDRRRRASSQSDRDTIVFDNSIQISHPLSLSNAPFDGKKSPTKEPGPVEVDGMGTSSVNIMRTGSMEPANGDYFGPSSTTSFLGLVRQVISCSGDLNDNCLSALDGAQGDVTPNPIAKPPDVLQWSALRQDSTAFHVPMRGEAESLVAHYWTWMHTLYPFLVRQTFMQRFEKLWEPAYPGPNTKDDVLFHCLLNAVFALGSQFETSQSPESRIEKSESFFLRSQNLMSLELLDTGNILLVQSLLLMTQYLQSTDKPDLCWSMAGLAIRVAQAIGLQLDHEEAKQGSRAPRHSQLQQEARKRAWGGCILLDRVLAMVYGRPLMIHPDLTGGSVHFPELIDDQDLSDNLQERCEPDDDVPRVMTCYSFGLKLQQIIGNILATYYETDKTLSSLEKPTDSYSAIGNPSLDRLNTGDLQDLVRLERSLAAWQASLPNHLRFSKESHAETAERLKGAISENRHDVSGFLLNKSIVFARQATVLRLRFLHVRLFLFRPALLILLDREQYSFAFGTYPESSSALRQKMLDGIADHCVIAAQELVEIIHDYQGSTISPLTSWWYNVFYLHNCAIIIVIAFHCPSLHLNIRELDLRNSWRKCLAALRLYQKYSDVAKRACWVLEMIDEQIFINQEDPANQFPEVPTPLTFSPRFGAAPDFSTSLDPPSRQRQIHFPFLQDANSWINASTDSSWISSDFGWLSTMPFLRDS